MTINSNKAYFVIRDSVHGLDVIVFTSSIPQGTSMAAVNNFIKCVHNSHPEFWICRNLQIRRFHNKTTATTLFVLFNWLSECSDICATSTPTPAPLPAPPPAIPQFPWRMHRPDCKIIGNRHLHLENIAKPQPATRCRVNRY